VKPIRALRAYVRHAPAWWPTATAADTVDGWLQRSPVTTVARTIDGTRVPVMTVDLLQRYLYLFGVWEPNITSWIRRRLRPGQTFIDIGANIGYYSLLAARLVGPSGHVVAVEASPRFAGAITDAAASNGYRNIRVANAAVSDTTEELTFYLEHHWNLSATTIVRPDGSFISSFRAQAVPLTDILTAAELASARIIKVDVEGAEAAVMHSLAGRLDQLRPDVELVIEITPSRLASQGRTAADITGPLLAAGFHPYRINNGYHPRDYLNRRPRPAPLRWDEPIAEQSDMIFSRTDHRELP
jgi:FkbM family methyltransferase